MDDSTVKATVEFGEKATFSHTAAISQSTTAYVDETLTTQPVFYCSGTYKSVDYSDERKMEIYRKINKMLGGK